MLINRKSILIIFLFILICSNAAFSRPRRIQSNKNQINYEFSGYMEAAYYKQKNFESEIVFEGAGIDVKVQRSNLTGLISLNYKDKNDTFFNDDPIYLQQLAAEFKFDGNIILVGKTANLNLPKTYDFYTRNLLTSSLIDNMFYKTNPFGIQYSNKSGNFYFTAGYFTAPDFIAAPVYGSRITSTSVLANNYDETDGKAREFYTSVGFYSPEAGMNFKAGLAKGLLSHKSRLNLQSLTGNSTLTDDEKNLWFVSLNQNIEQMYFLISYYNLEISGMDNILYDVLLSYDLQQNLTAAAAYNKSKYKNLTAAANNLLNNKTQYVFSLNYSMDAFNVGYEYARNKSSAIAANQNTHLFKLSFLF